MLIKRATMQVSSKTASVAHVGSGDNVIENVINKTAGKLITENTHNKKSFDIKAEIENHADDSIFIRALAIRANEPNQNGDHFSESELKKAVSTFVGVPLFCNHENGEIEKARGCVIASEWDDDEKAIYTISRVDREAYPQLARGVEEGYISGVSMGCSVDYSKCSICGKKATTEKDYCDHVKNQKGKSVNGKKVYEDNYGVKFIELSFVTDPACPDCMVQEILDPEDFLMKAANLTEAIKKVASLKKKAGPDEMNWLAESVDNMSKLIQYFVQNREYIDLSFAGDAVEILDKMQNLKDSLDEAGFGAAGAGQPQEEAAPASPEEAFPEASVGEADMPPPPGGEVGTEVGDPAGLGLAAKIKTDLNKTAKLLDEFNTFERSGKLADNNNKSGLVEAIRSLFVRKPKVETTITASDDNHRIVIAEDKVVGYRDDQEIASWDISSLNDEVKSQIHDSPQEAAEAFLSGLKDIEASTTKTTKTAEKAPAPASQTEVITEKQLDGIKPPLHPREDDERDVITEKQLDGNKWDVAQDGRQEDEREVITEKQLDERKYSDKTERQDDAWEVITEKQLDTKGDTSPRDEKPREVITEKQMESMPVANRKDDAWEVITEKQLMSQKDPLGRRQAANKMLKATVAALADSAITLSASPESIVKTAKKLIASPKVMVETAEALKKADVPAAKTARANATYWNKMASVIASPQESANIVLAEIRDNMESIVETPELAVQALDAVLSTNDVVARIDEEIKAKTAETEAVEEPATMKELFNEVLTETPETEKEAKTDDNIVVIKASVEEIEADPKSDEFKAAAFAYGRKLAEKEGLTIEADIDVEHEDEKLIAIKMETAPTTASEDVEKAAETKKENLDKRATARRKAAGITDEKMERQAKRDELVKKAQFGGEPGGMPAAPAGAEGVPAGGGTTMPAPPMDEAAGAPPMESFQAPEMGAEEVAVEETDNVPEPGNPQPPGSICPVCGSEDVDLLEGEGKCNSCSSEFTMAVSVNVDKWKGTLDGSGDEGEEVEITEEAEGAELPEAGLPEVPVNASFKITPESLIKTGNKKVGSHCPNCGSEEVKIANGKGTCEKCAQDYSVDILVDQDDPKSIYASVTWLPKVECPECLKKSAKKAKSRSRGKCVFQSDDSKVKDNKDHFPINSVAQARNALARASQYDKAPKWYDGKLTSLVSAVSKAVHKEYPSIDETEASKKPGKQSSKEGKTKEAQKRDIDPTVNSSQTTGPVDNEFPMESCRERMARRWGENAVCLSGPFEGQPLVDSVCNMLSKAETKSVGLGMKIAERVSEREPMSECLEDQIRQNYTMAQAKNICECLKNKYASEIEEAVEEFIANEKQIHAGIVDEIEMDFPPEGDMADSVDVVDVEAPEEVVVEDVTDEVVEDVADEVVEEVADEKSDEEMSAAEMAEDIKEDVDKLVEKVEEESAGTEEFVEDDVPVAELDEEEVVEDVVDDAVEDVVEEGPVEEEVVEEEIIAEKKEGNDKVSENKTDAPVESETQEQTEEKEEDLMMHASRIKSEKDSINSINLDKLAKQIGDPKPVDEAADLKGEVPEDSQTLGQEPKELQQLDDPKVPDKGGKATIGDEAVIPAAKPDVPAGSGNMGDEQFEGGNVETKGTVIAEEEAETKEAGKIKGPGIPDGTGPMKDSPECKMNKKKDKKDKKDKKEASVKTAGEKQVEAPKPVDEAKDLKGKVPEDSQTLGKEPKELQQLAQPEVPEKGGKATQGDEPNFSAEKAKVPAGSGNMGEEIFDGGNVETKGTTIAGSEDAQKAVDIEKVKMARYQEAVNVASKELAAGLIDQGEFNAKVAELTKMPIPGIKAYANTIEKQIQKKAATGLPAEKSDGALEQGIVIASKAEGQEETLKDKLVKQFSLTKKFEQ